MGEGEMKIDQRFVDRVIARAKNSDYGLGEAETHKANVLRIDQYDPEDLQALALLLVNAYTAKYDLVSVFYAALQELEAQNQSQLSTLKATAQNNYSAMKLNAERGLALEMELTSLKAILEKKDEALRQAKENLLEAWQSDSTAVDEHEFKRICPLTWESHFRSIQEALALTPETYVKEEGKV